MFLDIPFLVDLLSRIMQMIIDLGGKPETITIFEALIKFFGGTV